jgi:AraC-like DNA-binding protein
MLFGQKDGMTDTMCRAAGLNSGFKDKSGRIWLAAGRNIVYFDPQRITTDRSAPKPIIKRVLVNGADCQFVSPIKLSNGRNHIQIEYTAIHFHAPEKIDFSFKLAGFDPSWQQAAERRFALYQNIPDGQYSFQLKAVSANGVVNEADLIVSFITDIRFYQTFWFYGIAVLTLLSLLSVFHFFRMKEIIKTKQTRLDKSYFSADKAKEYLQKLQELMEQQKLYRDSNLSLHSLAAQIGIPRHYLSQLINIELQKNFFDYINEFRINEAKEKLQIEENDSNTIISIAYQVGFNSQSTFYSAFKKKTGTTPANFKKAVFNA